MKLIAGLGNPGRRYLFTRHNAGFMAIDSFLARYGLVITGQKFRSPFLSTHICGQGVVFIKPALYMNVSGVPVREAAKSMGLSPADLLVIHDDIDIPPGEARYKIGGGHGGHNGLKSIVSELGENGFCRIRIGVGRPPDGVDPSDYVLGNAGPEEKEALLKAFEDAFEFIENRFLAETGGRDETR